jgi:hypothetical protein
MKDLRLCTVANQVYFIDKQGQTLYEAIKVCPPKENLIMTTCPSVSHRFIVNKDIDDVTCAILPCISNVTKCWWRTCWSTDVCVKRTF